jgi:hypothetical protein
MAQMSGDWPGAFFARWLRFVWPLLAAFTVFIMAALSLAVVTAWETTWQSPTAFIPKRASCAASWSTVLEPRWRA